MGHIRLGRLPRSARWRDVVGLIESDPANARKIAASTITASERYLRSLGDDPALAQTYWTLVRLMSAARGDDFAGELRRLGLPASDDTPTVAFVAAVSDFVRRDLARQGVDSVAGEFAALALRRALTETVATQASSLFGSSVDDLRRAFRAHSTERQFGEVSRLFFGDFLSRVLRASIDREVPNVTSSVSDGGALLRAVDVHARQSAAIVRDFAGQWLSKAGYERAGDIPPDDVRRFVAVALGKLRSELKREGGSP